MSAIGKAYYAACSTRGGHLVARCTVACLRRLGFLRRFHLPLDVLSLDHRSVRALMALWSRIHWADTDGMMPADELLAIYRFAATWPVNGATVELGAWVGRTTSYLATACAVRGDGTVYAVDTFEGTKEGGTQYSTVAHYGGGTHDAFQDQIRRSGVAHLIRPLVGLSGEVGERFSGGPIRMLLIDADHSYDGVRTDWNAWTPHVAPGGLIIFHDYSISGVERFIGELDEQRDGIIIKPGLVLPNVYAVTKRAAPVVSAPVQPDVPVTDAGTATKPLS